jgi:hypothetical protein
MGRANHQIKTISCVRNGYLLEHEIHTEISGVLTQVPQVHDQVIFVKTVPSSIFCVILV